MSKKNQEFEVYHFEDEVVNSALSEGSTKLLIYRPQREMIVLGRGSNPEIEIELDRCLSDEVSLYRRRGGGCSVVLDPGNVIVTVAIPVSGIGENSRYFNIISRWLMVNLAKIGVKEVYQDGISDLVIKNHKIAGASIYRRKGLLHYSASILVNPQLKMVDRYLKHPPREPKYRNGRGHMEFIKSISNGDNFKDALEIEMALKKTASVEDLKKLVSVKP